VWISWSSICQGRRTRENFSTCTAMREVHLEIAGDQTVKASMEAIQKSETSKGTFDCQNITLEFIPE